MTITLATPRIASRAAGVQIVRSAGGITAWLVEDYAVPLVAFEMAFHGGAAQDPKGKSGAVAMMASLLDEGAGSLDADAFHRALDDKAIEISFSADRDAIGGRAKSLSRNVDAAVELLRLAVCEPRFDASAIDRVRSQIGASLRREAKDPDALASRAWREAAFPSHPYGNPVRGTLESLAAVTRDDIVGLHRSLLTRQTLKIAVVGAIDAERLRTILDRVFGDLPEQAHLSPVADIAIAPGERREVIDLDIPQATLRFGTNGIARLDDDHMAAVVVNHILGGGVFSARLFREVREKRGLAYSVYSQLSTFDHAAIFSGGTSTKNERAAESLSVIEDEIAKLTNEGPTEEELVKAKKYLTGSYALRFDTSLKIASQLVNLQTEGIGVDYLDERNGLIEAVTLDHAHRVAKRLFGGRGLLVTVVGRPEGMA
ncbi:M16 family metallopeptidase [Lichenifustis flavocetrariae]|uniref:Insulinase family protein n=1 Tax=Lichenifustis flavocetrariae TaxID=2949735 RepID=A0AA41Z0G5_9HYPH|nr:pitrilysin family protein [Lichenifustis flavocetrariae]MCW6510498.1 insulinase family protein [Lichenifustis flavocetrariae]